MTISSKSLFITEIITIFIVAITGFLLLVNFIPAYIIIDVQLLLYLFILLLNYQRNKSFNIYQIWVVGYIFIIWSEMCITSYKEVGDIYLLPYVRFTLANFFVLMGYHIYNKKHHINVRTISKTNWLFPFMIIVLYVLYVTQSASSAIANFQTGRHLTSAKGSSTLIGSLLSALGTLLPALIAFYVKYVKNKKNWISFIYSLPIFIIVFFQATRYKVLFSVIPYLVITDVLSLEKTSKKSIVILFISGFLVISISSFLKENRNYSFAELEAPSLFQSSDSDQDGVFVKLAGKMSPEGVVKMAYIADVYFSSHSLHWGKEMSFILYFWVPRLIWPEKPTQLDYWLIRDYSSETVADAFSSASGFIGESRADFGWGCLLFSLFIGMLLKRIDGYKRRILTYHKGSFNIVFVSILIPWAFFFVRSPITSTMSLIWELLFYYVFVLLFTTSSKYD